MPHYTVTLDIARPVADLFAYLTRPKNLVKLAPPDMHLELVIAPEVLALGERIVWTGRRWGVSQKIIQEVTVFEIEKRISVEQKQGPFARWIHASQFEVIDMGTRITENIEFAPPGGILGRLIGGDVIRKEFDKLVAYREKKLREIFA
jgi:ligand-binding SRPBCC domain-containing protein